MIEPGHKTLSIRRQCELLDVNRSLIYRTPKPVAEADVRLCNLIDEIYTKRPYYGTRRMRKELFERAGILVNRKHIQRLMRLIGLEAIYQKPNLSRRNMEHKIYPYLLRNVAITRPNQVWSTDITYIRTKAGFVYLTAVLDWYSRKVLSWRVSNTLDSSFCVEALEEALKKYGTPEIFNTDQGSQFTSEAFTSVLLARGIQVSMDGKGRALDNVFVERLWRSVKYEEVYLRGYETIKDAKAGLAEYFRFYNTERFHQGLDERTPDDVYFNHGAETRAA